MTSVARRCRALTAGQSIKPAKRGDSTCAYHRARMHNAVPTVQVTCVAPPSVQTTAATRLIWRGGAHQTSCSVQHILPRRPALITWFACLLQTLFDTRTCVASKQQTDRGKEPSLPGRPAVAPLSRPLSPLVLSPQHCCQLASRSSARHIQDAWRRHGNLPCGG